MGAKPLTPGVYEHLVTRLLSARTDVSDAVALEPLKAEHLAELLAKHVAAEVRRMFASAPASSHLDLVERFQVLAQT